MQRVKKAIIIGGSAQRRYFKDDKRSEIWMLNGQWLSSSRDWVPRIDRAFNLHRAKLLKYYKYDLRNEGDWTQENPSIPFYTMDHWPRDIIQNRSGWRQFPFEDMAKKMRRGGYHCGSFDWMVAFAVYLGFKEIEIHGVGLCLEAGEPISARACLEYWCGYAEGRGVKVTVAPDCDFFHFYHLVKSTLTYGLDDTPIYEDRTKKGVPYDYGG